MIYEKETGTMSGVCLLSMSFSACANVMMALLYFCLEGELVAKCNLNYGVLVVAALGNLCQSPVVTGVKLEVCILVRDTNGMEKSTLLASMSPDVFTVWPATVTL